jgi:hypothetical protein
MTTKQDYAACLASSLSPGFSINELVNGTRTKMLPPEHMWDRMKRPLQLANALRDVMKEKHGAPGLRVNAAFRPVGGARNSMHKMNRALDLDLLPGDYKLTHVYYEEAVRLWCTLGRDEPIGLGLYCPGDACNGIRVHIDSGFYPRSRHWQHGAHAGKADQIIIANRLGLLLPGDPIPVLDEGSDDKEAAE